VSVAPSTITQKAVAVPPVPTSTSAPRAAKRTPSLLRGQSTPTPPCADPPGHPRSFIAGLWTYTQLSPLQLAPPFSLLLSARKPCSARARPLVSLGSGNNSLCLCASVCSRCTALNCVVLRVRAIPTLAPRPALCVRFSFPCWERQLVFVVCVSACGAALVRSLACAVQTTHQRTRSRPIPFPPFTG
jgi:hypothetical protein